jgi:hypothetical protein
MHQSQRLSLPQLMLGDGPEHAVLFLVREANQLVPERRPDHAPAELFLPAAREPAAERHPSLDPLALVPQQPPDRTRAELLLVAKRADHPRLVERRAGARRGVGREQPTLVFRARPRSVHHHGHHAVASLPPPRQALEAVEYLVVAVGKKRDQQREFRTELLTGACNARPQPRVVSP